MPATLVDVADQYVVLRSFPALGRQLERGEVLDCSNWRNVQPLINTRRLAPIYAPEGRAALAWAEENRVDDEVSGEGEGEGDGNDDGVLGDEMVGSEIESLSQDGSEIQTTIPTLSDLAIETEPPLPVRRGPGRPRKVAA